jgi:hypothetical protein
MSKDEVSCAQFHSFALPVEEGNRKETAPDLEAVMARLSLERPEEG